MVRTYFRDKNYSTSVTNQTYAHTPTCSDTASLAESIHMQLSHHISQLQHYTQTAPPHFADSLQFAQRIAPCAVHVSCPFESAHRTSCEAQTDPYSKEVAADEQPDHVDDDKGRRARQFAVH